MVRSLLACAEIAAFAHSETHLLAWPECPRDVPHRGFLPEELLEEEKKRAQEILNERHRAIEEKRIHRRRTPPAVEPSRGRDQPLAAELKCDLIVVGHQQKASFGLALVARIGGKDAAGSRAVQYFCGADEDDKARGCHLKVAFATLKA